ncbi:Sh3px3 protein [Coprinopsis cinerea okayama7|uniref:Sh3px3 protein n=1 Tax=Coprinopsis cinerea (strain Okayama-7 / 130 / ATCC MYA-4618 / FGSC 9003) TaxID=240176 RepID=D6RPR1_COPC7|nr:Sh3px3 protein [Coprinopsis cinerea okayama7\|eukprot:XP_002910562.1 Sh3px3 protein [Coprinopsis cinerea okayama7\
MATLPRSATKSSILARPTTDFDSGINSSAAWTESNKPSIPQGPSTRRYLSESHLQSHGSLSDDEFDDGGDELEEPARKARALFDFQGKPEFRELDVNAGDPIDVLKEDVGEGWSLVRNESGEMGLLPQTYYTFTSELSAAPDLEIDSSPNAKQYPKQREPSSDSITPRGSPRNSQAALPLFPQNTGEWQAFPNFRRSLLGGKSLNRFSAFVTSGAEEFVLKGSPVQPEEDAEPTISHGKEDSTASLDEEEQNRLSRVESDRHFVDPGPTWKEKVGPFRVLVHSPSKRTSLLSGAYTVYSITSLFHESDTDEEAIARVTVHRRFSHFVVLHTALTRRLPGIALPPLPEKQYAGRFSADFVEARRGDLERYMNKIVKHPIARYAEIVTFFLSCESDSEWKHLLPEHLAMPPAGPSFYARVYHPAFNVDADEAQDSVGLFEAHTKAVDKGNTGGPSRFVLHSIPSSHLDLTKHAARNVQGRKATFVFTTVIDHIQAHGVWLQHPGITEQSSDQHSARASKRVDEWGGSLVLAGQLTKAMQKTSETLQSVADLYDDHARRTQLATHEYLKTMAHPSSIYEGVITTHRETLTRWNEAVYGNMPDEDVAARCETVLNITMAEMNTYHTQKVDDFRTLAVDHLDGEIHFYEQIVARLKAARQNFDPDQLEELGTSPRKSSIYERELDQPRLDPTPLPQPCPHVYDSTPMRPVSVAIQEGVNLFLGSEGRGSVFSKLWSH